MLDRKKGRGAFFVLSGKPGNSFESISPFLVSNCQFMFGSLFGKMDLRFMEEALSGGNISKLQISYSGRFWAKNPFSLRKGVKLLVP